MNIKQFIKDWTLVIAILAGIIGYFVYVNIPWLDSTHTLMLNTVEVVQPLLIFAMLFLTFLKIDPHDIRPCRWHLWLLLIQVVAFTLLGSLAIVVKEGEWSVVIQGAMMCLICPTATAAAVITHKLGGSMAHVTTYTILINLANALLIPVFAPLVHPQVGISVYSAAIAIMGKVFPLLILPLVLGMIVRKLLPGVKRLFDRAPDLAFYLWAMALMLAIMVTVRSIVHTHVSLVIQMWLVVVSLGCCLLQFWLGRKIGRVYDDTVTAGQALGQKNTVFIIWVSYTFFSPITALVGGFYSIWHNVVNTWQLYRHQHSGK